MYQIPRVSCKRSNTGWTVGSCEVVDKTSTPHPLIHMGGSSGAYVRCRVIALRSPQDAMTGLNTNIVQHMPVIRGFRPHFDTDQKGELPASGARNPQLRLSPLLTFFLPGVPFEHFQGRSFPKYRVKTRTARFAALAQCSRSRGQ